MPGEREQWDADLNWLGQVMSDAISDPKETRDRDFLLARMDRILSHLRPPPDGEIRSVPDGLVLVPREPTPEMVGAFWRVKNRPSLGATAMSLSEENRALVDRVIGPTLDRAHPTGASLPVCKADLDRLMNAARAQGAAELAQERERAGDLLEAAYEAADWLGPGEPVAEERLVPAILKADRDQTYAYNWLVERGFSLIEDQALSALNPQGQAGG